MNRLVYIALIFILSCSLNSDSAFWSQTKKVETDKIITKILFKGDVSFLTIQKEGAG